MRPDGGAEQLRGARGEAGHRLGGVALAFSRVVHVRAQVSARLRRPPSTSTPLVRSSRALPHRLRSTHTRKVHASVCATCDTAAYLTSTPQLC